MTDYAVPTARADQWALVERRLNESGLVGYQRMVVCSIFEHENAVAALRHIAMVVGSRPCGGDESVASGASVDANVQVHQGQGRNGSGGLFAASTGILGGE